jgi:serine/threonine protein kinase
MNTDILCMGCMKEKGTASVCPHCGWKEDTIEDYSQQYLPIRSTLNNKFLVGRVLGYGGFGITYIGWDMDLDVKVAIKEYMPQGLVGRTQDRATVSIYTNTKKQQFEYGMEKFLEEAKTIAKFGDHPNIVSVKHLFKENGTAYFVMNYVEGITLKQYISMEKDNKIEFSKVQSIAAGVLEALTKIHSKGLMHRDISPDNIYISKNGIVKVLDFGAARYALGENSSNLSVILKPGYAPEEQYRSKGKQGPWTDIYALAATIYNALTGEIPQESLDRLEEDNLLCPSKLGVQISGKSEKALMKALSVKSKERYENVEEFKQDFLGEDYKASPLEDVSEFNYKLMKDNVDEAVEANYETDNKTALISNDLHDRTALISNNLPDRAYDDDETKIDIKDESSKKNKDAKQVVNENPNKYVNSKVEKISPKTLLDNNASVKKKNFTNIVSSKQRKLISGLFVIMLVIFGVLFSLNVIGKTNHNQVVLLNKLQSDKTTNNQDKSQAQTDAEKAALNQPTEQNNTTQQQSQPEAQQTTQQQAQPQTQQTTQQQAQPQTQQTTQQQAQPQTQQTTQQQAQPQTQQTTQQQAQPEAQQTTPAANYDLVNQYIVAAQYDKAVLEASKIISSGDNSSQILSLMNTAAHKLDDTAYSLYHSGSKDQSAKYYALLASTKGVPQNFAKDGKSNTYDICYELSTVYFSKKNYYNIVYYANWALWAGNTKAQDLMTSAANALYEKALTDISNNNMTGVKGALDLLAHITKWAPQSYVPKDIQSSAEETYKKYFN